MLRFLSNNAWHRIERQPPKNTLAVHVHQAGKPLREPP